MPTYLDISVSRIQSYLSRTPHLRARRGASAALSAVTAADAWRGAVPELQVNKAAGDIDGKISAIIPDGGDPAAFADQVFMFLRPKLPAADFEATWSTADDYLTAYGTGDAMISVAPVDEFPGARRCQLCGVDPAETTIRTVEDTQAGCADCAVRYVEGNNHGGKRSAESRLLEDLGMDPDRAAKDFSALARLGARKQNHLATIYIDGNAVGAFFRALIDQAVPGRASVSLGVVEATRDALRSASEAVADPAEAALPVVAHLVGGDDVLVSVTAELAWSFVTQYLRQFQAGVRQLVDQHAPQLVDRSPTASAGVVFAHASHPFQRCVEAADQLCAAAKRDHSGTASCALWTDVTQEGEQSPPDRRAWGLHDLDGFAPALAQLAGLPKSTAAGLGQAVTHPEDRVAAAYATRQASRHPGGIAAVTTLLKAGGAQRLRNALAIARWWPPAAEEVAATRRAR